MLLLQVGYVNRTHVDVDLVLIVPVVSVLLETLDSLVELLSQSFVLRIGLAVATYERGGSISLALKTTRNRSATRAVDVDWRDFLTLIGLDLVISASCYLLGLLVLDLLKAYNRS